jgi:periplasmic divalent cation tolerance protein
LRDINLGVIVISTFPSLASARRGGKIMLKKKLCACVNIIQSNSIYIWKNKLVDDNEYLCLFKTTKQSSEVLKREIKSSHPYELPEIVELRMNQVEPNYFNWIIESTKNRIK